MTARAKRCRECGEKHQAKALRGAETLARLRRDVAPGIAAALARWATVRP